MNKEDVKEKKHNFNEKTTEQDLPVWQSPKYVESKKEVEKMIDSNKYGLIDSDFWILMNKTSKGDKMAYTGLIISHNGCLKINDHLEDKLKFKPSCVKENKEGFESSLVFTYSNDEQGIYEVGELSESNYKQKNGRYPYAMGYKRLFDRVVLKNSKLAYAGVYSDNEAEEFTEKVEEKETMDMIIQEKQKQYIIGHLSPSSLEAQLKKYKVLDISALTWEQANEIYNLIDEALKKQTSKVDTKKLDEIIGGNK